MNLNRVLREELGGVWPLLEGGAYDDFTSLLKEVDREEAVVVGREDDPCAVAVISRWRHHLPYGWIKAFSSGRTPEIWASAAADVAFDRGFEVVVSPLLDRLSRPWFIKAGFKERERILLMATEKLGGIEPVGPADLCRLSRDHLERLEHMDGLSFDEFWRFGRKEFEQFMGFSTAMGALLKGELVGYNVVTVKAGLGVLARLAVIPEARGLGIGRQLMLGGIIAAIESGASSMLLSTQSDNRAARSLYQDAGFRKIGERYLLARSR